MKVKFGDIVNDVKKNVNRSNNPYEFYVAGDHMDSEDFSIRRRGRFATDDVGPAFIRIFHPGQVLYGSRRTYLKKVCVADFDGVCANTTFVFETKNENVLTQRFLPFLMLSDGFTDWSIKHSKGSTNPYVLFSDLADYEFDLPPIERQRELADLLWAANDLKEAYKKLIAASDEMIQAKFKEMFGVRNKEFLEIRYDVQLEEIVEILNNKRKPINDSVRSKMRTGTLYPYYGTNGVVDYINEYLTDEDLLCIAEDCGSYGPGEVSSYIIRGKAWVNNHAHLVRPKLEICLLEYLNFFLKISDLRMYIAGTTRQKLTQAMLRKIRCILPPLSLQEEFVEIVNQQEKVKQNLRESIAQVENIIKGLINS